MRLAQALAVVLAALTAACGAPVADSPAVAYWQLRARSEEAAYVASYDTSAGPALVYALPPNRRLDEETIVAGEPVTVARFYRREGTYVCEMTHRPIRCTVTDEPDGTPHAQPGAPSLTRIERAPGRTVAGLAATCFVLIALADERFRREVCFSADAVLLLVIGTNGVDGPADRLEATRVTTTVDPDQLNPFAP